MAKKKTINKSAELRDYLAKNPDAKPKQIKEAFAKRNIDVSDALIWVQSAIRVDASVGVFEFMTTC